MKRRQFEKHWKKRESKRGRLVWREKAINNIRNMLDYSKRSFLSGLCKYVGSQDDCMLYTPENVIFYYSVNPITVSFDLQESDGKYIAKFSSNVSHKISLYSINRGRIETHDIYELYKCVKNECFDPFDEIVDDVLLQIIEYLSPQDLLRCHLVSKKWNNRLNRPHLQGVWKTIRETLCNKASFFIKSPDGTWMPFDKKAQSKKLWFIQFDFKARYRDWTDKKKYVQSTFFCFTRRQGTKSFENSIRIWHTNQDNANEIELLLQGSEKGYRSLRWIPNLSLKTSRKTVTMDCVNINDEPNYYIQNNGAMMRYVVRTKNYIKSTPDISEYAFSWINRVVLQTFGYNNEHNIRGQIWQAWE